METAVKPKRSGERYAVIPRLFSVGSDIVGLFEGRVEVDAMVAFLIYSVFSVWEPFPYGKLPATKIFPEFPPAPENGKSPSFEYSLQALSTL